MRLGIDIRSAIHEPAGVGTLTSGMLAQLIRIDRDNEYYLYADAPYSVGISNTHCFHVMKSFGDSSVGRILWHPYAAFDARYRRRLDRFISIGSLQISAMTSDFTVLIIPDLSHVLFPEFHRVISRQTGRLLMKRALLNARMIIAISEHTKSDILTYMGGTLSASKIAVAHIACDELYARKPSTEKLNLVRGRYMLPEKYVLSVGTLEPRKNYETLITAFRQCVTNGVAHDLVIAGRKGWFFETIFEEVRKQNLESRVHFLGFIPLDDMPALYSMAEAFVYPSLYEGFGIPPLEAMTCGVPVITSNVTSLPEVTGTAAILVNPRDVQALSAEMERLLRDEQLRAHYIRAGLERSRHFSWKIFAENVLKAVQL